MVHSLQDAVNLAAKQDYKQLMVIGGGQIYELALPLAHTIMLTRVHTTIEGDAFFPEFSLLDWKKEQSEQFAKDDKNEFNFEFVTYKKIKS